MSSLKSSGKDEIRPLQVPQELQVVERRCSSLLALFFAVWLLQGNVSSLCDLHTFLVVVLHQEAQQQMWIICVQAATLSCQEKELEAKFLPKSPYPHPWAHSRCFTLFKLFRTVIADLANTHMEFPGI